MTKLKRRLTRVAMPWPAERVSSGWISEGYNHPKGPPAHREAGCSVTALSIRYTCTHNSSGQQIIEKLQLWAFEALLIKHRL